jgi:predicted secreted protein
MRWTSMVAIYTLFWVLSAFFVLPFGVRTADEDGTRIATGHADSAPTNYDPRRIARRATVLSVVLFAMFYLNYVNAWVLASDLDISRLYPGKPD